MIPVTGHIYTIGRLDRSSEGLILITNDGDLANELTHPRFGVEKTYSVRVAGQPTFDQLKPLTSGIRLADGVARAARVSVKKRRPHATDLEIVLREGRNREIRRVLAAIGHKVLALRRIAVGTLRLADLPSGAHRRLTADEVEALRVSVREGPGRPETSRRSRSPAPRPRVSVRESSNRSEASRRSRSPAPRPRVSVRESSNRSEAGRARTASRAPLPGKGTRRRKRLGGKSSSPPRRPAKQGEPAPSSRSRSAAGRRPRRGDVPGGGRPPKAPSPPLTDPRRTALRAVSSRLGESSDVACRAHTSARRVSEGLPRQRPSARRVSEGLPHSLVARLCEPSDVTCRASLSARRVSEGYSSSPTRKL